MWAERLREGGVDVQVLPIFVEDMFLPGLGLRESLLTAEGLLSDLEYDSSRMTLARDYAGIEAALGDGKIAAVMALEGCDGFGGDPALLRPFYRLGARMVGLTWERRNEFADGTGVINPGGLTKAGRQAVSEMVGHKVICDVSHLAEPGFWDVMELAQTPIIASHSNARSVCDHPRNLTDDQIRAIAETGGVIGLNFFAYYVHPTEATLEALLDAWIADCQAVEEVPRFTALLVERGYSDAEIALVLGENWLRVFERMWG